MRIYKADLHIHTCLSPCAEIDISPLRIMQATRQQGLDIVGICDHKFRRKRCGGQTSGGPRRTDRFGGMEITSEEEVHILALVEDDDALFTMQQLVYDYWPGFNDDVLGFSERLLIGSTELPIWAE